MISNTFQHFYLTCVSKFITILIDNSARHTASVHLRFGKLVLLKMPGSTVYAVVISHQDLAENEMV